MQGDSRLRGVEMNADAASAGHEGGTREFRAWVVRAGRWGERVEANLESGLATIGWDECEPPDLSLYEDRAAYGECIDRQYAGLTKSLRQKARDQIWRFYHQISVGDAVILPLKNFGTADDWIAIGRVTGAATFDGSRPAGALHSRPVSWVARSVPKSSMPETLQRSITNTNNTVFGLTRDQAPQRVLALVGEFFDAAPAEFEEGHFGLDDVHADALPGDEAGVLGEDGRYVEGATTFVQVLAHERNSDARWACIKEHGTRCKVCDIDFGEEYGDFASGYIHVHHIVPLAQAAQKGEYELKPLEDLVPVCPNCHAMLHRHPDRPCSVETLKALRESKQGASAI